MHSQGNLYTTLNIGQVGWKKHLEVTFAQVLVGMNITAWFIAVPFIFYYLLAMGSSNPGEKELYRWGIVRYCFCTLWFTVGSAFVLMNQSDWQLLCDSILENMAKIIGAIFWVAFAFFVGYFFKYRLPKEKRNRGLVGAQPATQSGMHSYACMHLGGMRK